MAPLEQGPSRLALGSDMGPSWGTARRWVRDGDPTGLSHSAARPPPGTCATPGTYGTRGQ
jgi:hypothetical protein